MKLITLLAGAALATSAFAAQATVVTFDAGVPSTPSYSEAGVTFEPIGGGTIVSAADPNGTLGLLSYGPVDFVPIRATFATLTSGDISIDLGDYDSDADDLFLRLYDSSNNVLATTAASISADFTGMVTLTAGASNVAYAEFGGVGVNGSSVYADNFTFNANSAVPEPASWAMMIAGVGATGFGLRRRRTIAPRASFAG